MKTFAKDHVIYLQDDQLQRFCYDRAINTVPTNVLLYTVVFQSSTNFNNKQFVLDLNWSRAFLKRSKQN